jgi:hypothetical protein
MSTTMEHHKVPWAMRLVAVVALAAAIMTPGTRPADAAAGVASYPDRINYQEVLRGTDYVRPVSLVSGYDVDAIYTFEFEGDTADWVEIVDMETREPLPDEIPVRPQEFTTIGVSVRVPDDAPNGAYQGSVNVVLTPADPEAVAFEGVPEDDEGSRSAVGTGVVILVDMDVTGTENIAAEYLTFRASDAEPGIPMRFAADIRNTGNVLVNPVITVEMLKDGEVFDTVVVDDVPVPPGELTTVNGSWDTTNADVASYVARASIQFRDLDLGTKEADFDVFQRGQLTRQGQLVRMELPNGTPPPNGVAQVDVWVQNTGSIEARAVFVGEFYKGEDLLEVVESLPRLLIAGESGVIEVFLDVGDPGVYTLVGKANFEGKDTESQTLTFEVIDPFAVLQPEESGTPWVLYGGIGGGVLVLAAGFLLFRRRRGARLASGGGVDHPMVGAATAGSVTETTTKTVPSRSTRK